MFEMLRLGSDATSPLSPILEGATEIVWNNEGEESGKPFDIQINCVDGPRFVEVKSRERVSSAFFISKNEVSMMMENRGRYHIIIVFRSTNQWIILSDPVSSLEGDSLKLFMVIR